MTDNNFPKIFQTEYELRESVTEIMARTGMTYSEVRDCLVFWVIDGHKAGVRVRADENDRLWLEYVGHK